MSNEKDDFGSARIRLGPIATNLALECAGDAKITQQHLDDAIGALISERDDLVAGQRDAATKTLLAELKATEDRIVERLSGQQSVLARSVERLLNGINGLRHLFGIYAVQLTGGDIDEAVRDINDRIDTLSKPIAVSREERQSNDQRRDVLDAQAAAQVDMEMAMASIDGDMPATNAVALDGPVAEEGLEL